MISLDQLHDATFLSLDLNWRSGELSCNLRIHGDTVVRLVAHGLTFLKCPRQFPWGPSVSVNYARVNKAENGRVFLIMEMQSGDVIEADLEDVALEIA